MGLPVSPDSMISSAARPRAVAGAVAALLVALAAMPAAGQSDATKKRAQELQTEGRRLAEKGDNRAALEKFDEAYRLVPSPKILFNRGQAHLALGDDIEALNDLEGFLDQAPYAPKVSRDEAAQAVEALRPKLSYVEIQVDGAGATIALDGREIGTAPLPHPVVVAPGTHQLRVTKAGMNDETRSVSPIAGQKVRVEISLTAVTVAAPPPAVTPPAAASAPDKPPTPAPIGSHEQGDQSERASNRPWQITAAWVAGGAGVLFLGGAITAQLLSASKTNQFNAVDNAQNGTQMCNQTLPQDGGGPCQGLADAAHLRHTIAIAGFVATGVAAAGALVFYLTAAGTTGDHAMAALCLPSEGGASCALTATF